MSDEDNAEEMVGEMNTNAEIAENDDEANVDATNDPIMDNTLQ
jgi:catabolite regulation protein CreA